ncbi:hypothetical protein AC578_10023 [Pseudocercospora eumusae]|uniref:Uncharacterized protein n=1 Tax=Pseudocercospora eumusae TaxID=321146 RepID=A0A139HMI3_9PEZI|nr:hypothetical protein AC578_10023 [Pseudocercospora eumusae]
MPFVIPPHHCIRLQHNQCSEQCAYQRDKAGESRDSTGDDVGDKNHARSAAEPHCPMLPSLGVYVPAAGQAAEKYCLGRNLPGSPRPYATFLMRWPADPKAGDVTYEPQK